MTPESERPPDWSYVAVSHIAVPADGVIDLDVAFRSRLGAVDGWPGFCGLEVLRHRRRPESYLMITRWRSRRDFELYMRSPDHRTSHGRIPTGPGAPRPAGFDDYELVAW